MVLAYILKDSMRVTVALAVTAALSLIIFKKPRATNSEFLVRSNCFVCFSPTAWVNAELIEQWIDHAFIRVVSQQGKALVWDSCRAHTAKLVKEQLVQRQIRMWLFPVVLQACDLGEKVKLT